MKIKDIDKIEIANELSVNVFAVEKEGSVSEEAKRRDGEDCK